MNTSILMLARCIFTATPRCCAYCRQRVTLALGPAAVLFRGGLIHAVCDICLARVDLDLLAVLHAEQIAHHRAIHLVECDRNTTDRQSTIQPTPQEGDDDTIQP